MESYFLYKNIRILDILIDIMFVLFLRFGGIKIYGFVSHKTSQCINAEMVTLYKESYYR